MFGKEKGVDMIVQYLCNKYPGIDSENVRVINSPLRVCPFGAHIDHQAGMLAGFALNITIDMAYVSNDDGFVRVKSLDFPDEEYFHVDNVPAIVKNCWGNYLRGAVLALKRNYMMKKGIYGVIRGKGLIGGLSSSAAVITAYLMALCEVNNIDLSKLEYIMNSHWVETCFIGLKNGILDQSMNVLSKKNALTVMDPETMRYELVKKPENMLDFEVVIVCSGIEKPLVETNYNENVDVCRTAAWIIEENAGIPLGRFEDTKLRDIEYDTYMKYKNCLAGRFRRRTDHFFEENIRVKKGINAWREGDLDKLGKIMFASGESSIHNYNCGCSELITIFNILKETKGVYGARFSGAGYRGCCIGLINPEYKKTIKEEIITQYPKAHPKYKDKFKVKFAKMDDGAKFMSLPKERNKENEGNYTSGGLRNKTVSSY